MLGKWCWSLLNDKEGLWYRVLKARYGEMGARIKDGGRQGSWWWRTITRVCEGVGEGVGRWFEDNIRHVVGNGRNTLFWYDCWVGEMPLNLKFPRLFDLAVFKECLVEEMSTLGWTEGGGAWVWRRRLLVWEEESVRECSFLLHNIVLQDTVSDNWRWLLDPIHGYSVREAYRFITHSGDMVDRTFVDDVWHRHIPSKVSLLIWRLLRNRLSKDNLVRRGVLHANDITCGAARCDSNETASHLFLRFDNYCEVWSNVWN